MELRNYRITCHHFDETAAFECAGWIGISEAMALACAIELDDDTVDHVTVERRRAVAIEGEVWATVYDTRMPTLPGCNA